MNAYVKKICNTHGLKILQTFGAGHICPEVYQVRDKNGLILVLKIATESRMIEEIKKNLLGYKKLTQIGLAELCPEIIVTKHNNESGFIIMEYCGDDLHKRLEGEADPRAIYDTLASQMRLIYERSVIKENTSASIAAVIKKVTEQYNVYLLGSYGQEPSVQKKIGSLQQFFVGGDFDLSCFASWDFTPRNVFLKNGRVKYVDCNSDVIGIPTVDLACFAGVIRDVHALPGSKEGYEILKTLAIGEVSKILHMSEDQARKIFYLGRLLQCFLSSRHRLKSAPDLAQNFYSRGLTYLDRIIT